MPIEDVDYLRLNSVKQSYVFMVDSKDRDKLIYRTPAEYGVEFNPPFENVIGLEVLDASVPRTMYNVDAYNNQLRFFIYTSNYNWNGFTEGSWCNVAVETGDYTVQTLVPALNAAMQMRLNQDSNQPMVNITVEPISNPPDIKNKLRFYAPYPFMLDMTTSIAETLGFDMPISPTEAAVMPLASRWYNIFLKSSILTSPRKSEIYLRLPSKTNTEIIAELNLTNDERTWLYFARGIYENQNIYASVDIPFAIGDTSTYGTEVSVFEGPRSVIRARTISASSRIAQRFSVSSQIYLTKIEVAFTGPRESNFQTLLDTNAQWSLIQTAVGATSPLGGITLDSGNIAVSAVDGSYSVAALTTETLRLVPNMGYWMILRNNDNLPLSVYYNNVVNLQGNPMLVSANSGVSWFSLDEADIPYQMSCRLTGNYEYHEITAPGIYNLIGEKYVVLRCKEIEENSFRSLAYMKHTLGLAKFRLGVVGYSETRLDFNKVPLREFHPIGRLSRLSLRFEVSGGMLYDFKGVNHTITMAIHYLEPIQKLKFQQSILNPNYTGDFIGYRFHEDDQEGDSDDQEEDYSRDALGDYKKYEQRFHPEFIELENQRRMEDLFLSQRDR
jgi:hypothetical protein